MGSPRLPMASEGRFIGSPSLCTARSRTAGRAFFRTGTGLVTPPAKLFPPPLALLHSHIKLVWNFVWGKPHILTGKIKPKHWLTIFKLSSTMTIPYITPSEIRPQSIWCSMLHQASSLYILVPSLLLNRRLLVEVPTDYSFFAYLSPAFNFLQCTYLWN